MKKYTFFKTLALYAFLVALLSGCLKTRAQLNEDQGKPSSPVMAQNTHSQSSPARGYDPNAIDDLKTEFTRLTGRIDELERRTTQNEGSGSEERIQALETRIEELEKAQLEILSRMKAAPAASSENPEDLYKRGVDAFNKKNYDAALDHFDAYLSSNKPKEQAEATFYRAETYFKKEDYKKAIIDYSKFAENKFGKDNKKNPEALYRIGLSFEKLGMNDEANVFYQDLVTKYPKSSRTALAKKKLGKK